MTTLTLCPPLRPTALEDTKIRSKIRTLSDRKEKIRSKIRRYSRRYEDTVEDTKIRIHTVEDTKTYGEDTYVQ